MSASFLSIAGIVLIVQTFVLVFLTHDTPLIFFGIIGVFLVLADADILGYRTRSEDRSG